MQSVEVNPRLIQTEEFNKVYESSVSRPLDSIDEVLNWTPEGKIKPKVALESNKPKPKNQLILCHDMKGGYNEDKELCGFDGLEIPSEIWEHVSSFIYFSHRFVTVPTVSWIETCHKNDTLCLGTIITEWDKGIKLCSQFLDTIEPFVSQLAKIQKHYGFSGWLVNIENKLEMAQVPLMHKFVERLRALCGSVVWYDAVTVDGELKWQNGLTEKNASFFDAAGQLFTNYTFTEEHLKKSQTAAGDKSRQIFAGVDVFGRGTFGGGEMDTYVSVKASLEHNQNSAIFAPGWLVEKGKQDRAVEFWNLVGGAIGAKPITPPVTRNITLEVSISNAITDGERVHFEVKVVGGAKYFKVGEALYKLNRQTVPVWTSMNNTELTFFTDALHIHRQKPCYTCQINFNQ